MFMYYISKCHLRYRRIKWTKTAIHKNIDFESFGNMHGSYWKSITDISTQIEISDIRYLHTNIKLQNAGKINRIFFLHWSKTELKTVFTSMVSTPRKVHHHTHWVMLWPQSCGPSCWGPWLRSICVLTGVMCLFKLVS